VKNNIISNKSFVKKVHNIGTKKIVSIDELIVEKLKINENTFLEQEITEDGKIVMRIRKLEI